LTIDEFKTQLRGVGLVVSGQTKELAPADGKLYALRDVTGTVPSLPLIASSIMSKKIAAGADAIVLDVKAGRGAFMKTVEEAQALARAMVDIGKGVNRRVSAVISDMSQPLGCAIGNALEVAEAIDVLRGEGPSDFVEHCLAVGEQMLLLGGQAADTAAARRMLEATVDSGRAFEKLLEWVGAQGGDVSVCQDLSRMPVGPVIKEVHSPWVGTIAGIDAMEAGLTAVDLGAGRARKGDPIDHQVGLKLTAKVGDRVDVGDRLFVVYARDEADAEAAARRMLSAYTCSEEAISPPPLVYGVIQ
jgi:pyrimidine-nucleoside phosphorylase